MIKPKDKFRGRIENGVFVFGYLKRKNDGVFICDNIGNKYKVETETVGQFTGMYDCNGTEIYDRDIIKNLIFPEVKQKVLWFQGCWCSAQDEELLEKEINLLYENLQEFTYEIIGNIYTEDKI